MQQKIIFIGEKPIKFNHAGNKAREDVDTILRDVYGFPYENLEQTNLIGLIQKVEYLLTPSNLKMIYRIWQLQDRTVIVQYPFYYYNRILKKALNHIFCKNRVILFVHDIDALRRIQNSGIQEDIAELNKAKAVVVHNDVMAAELKKRGLKIPCISLELFDYLLPEIPKKELKKGTVIAFAGNLVKSEFLGNPSIQKLGIQFHLYGPGFKPEIIKWNNVKFQGNFLPEEIPFKLEENFGLIWDGTDTNTCTGRYGEYMKYNNPHKLSMYIVAGLPVIVWEEAAIANFVNKHNIGFAVNSLEEIQERIQLLSDDEYDAMVLSVKEIQKDIVHGGFTKRCLQRVERLLV